MLHGKEKSRVFEAQRKPRETWEHFVWVKKQDFVMNYYLKSATMSSLIKNDV